MSKKLKIIILIICSILVISTIIATVALITKEDVTLILSLDNGEESPQYIVKNGKIEKPDNPVKQGYTFDGWFADDAFIQNFDFNNIQGNGIITVYCRWKINSYSVIFNTNGGNDLETVQAQYNTKITEPAVPVKTGHTFAGWFADESFSVSFDFDLLITGDMTIYGDWTADTYTITINPSNGENTYIKNVEFGTQIGLIITPVKTGYTFGGWFTEADGAGNEYISDSVYNLTDDLVLTAKWSLISYSVIYDLDGGINGNNPSSYDITSVITLAEPTKENYRFEGWYNDSEFSGVPVESIEAGTYGNKSFYAKWIYNKYNVSFESNGGSLISSKKVSYGMTVTSETPERRGYDFEYWCTDTALQNVFDFDTAITDDITLYADWSIIEYDIIYNYNNNNPLSYTVLDAFVFTSPVKEGYIFDGWYDNDGLSGEPVQEIVANTIGVLMLYAKWTAVNNNLSFNGNGSTSGDMVAMVIATDSSAALTLNLYVRTGYTFAGWSQTSDGDVIYLDGTVYNMGVSLNNELFAIWTPNDNQLIFNVNGGEGTMDNQIIPSDTVVTVNKNTFTRNGYNFLGWSVKADGEAVYADSSSYTMGTDPQYNLYAIWTLAFTYTTTEDGIIITGYAEGQDNINLIIPDNIDGVPVIGVGGTGFSNSDLETIVIPDSVTEIGDGAFSGCADLVDVTIGSGVQIIGDGAFENTGITTVVIPDSVTIIGDNAFYGCSTLTKVTIGSGLLSIGTSAFENCIILNEIIIYTGIAPLLNENSLNNIASDYIIYVLTSASGFTAENGWNESHIIRIQSYKASFVTNGGNQIDDQYIVYPGLITVPTEIVRDGYVFDGWYQDSDFENIFDFSTFTVSDNITVYIYAKWIPNNNKLVFDGNNEDSGVLSEIIIATDNSVILPLNTFIKNGYHFNGWATEPMGSIVYLDGAAYVMGTGSTYTLYAVWQVINYDITYVLNEGVNVDNPDSYTILSSITLNNPAREGYTFGGWYAATDFSGDIVTGIAVGTTGEKTFYAKWTVIDYSITYVLNGGVNGDNPDSYTILSSITLNNPEREGYTFGGWYAATDFSGDIVTVIAAGITGEKTFYAKWTMIDYDIIYVLYDGTNESNATLYNIESDTIILLSPVKADYRFVGWYSNSSFSGAPVLEIAAGTYGELTFYAKWLFDQFNVSFETNGGNLIQSENVTGGTSVTEPAIPVKTGCTFMGWYTGPEFTEAYGFDTLITTDIVLYADWQIIEYSLTYVLDNGVNGANPETYKVTDSIILENPGKTGFEFNGWYDNAEFTGEAIISISSGTIGDKTLYAKWTVINYTITYIVNKGANGDNPETYTVLDAVSLDDAERFGIGFGGWYSNENYTGDSITEIAAGSTGNLIFYAKWIMINYDITYIVGEGENSEFNPQTYNIDSEIIVLQDAAREGYRFNGWFTNSEYSGIPIFEILPETLSNITIYAKWTIEQYTVSFDTNGGTSIISADINYNTFCSAPAVPVKTGYDFDKWYYGDTEYNFDTLVIEDIILTARWTAIEYVLTYVNIDAADNTVNPETYSIESGLVLNTPLFTGYTFSGWYDNINFTGSQIFSLPIGTIGEKTFYAKWDITVYTILYAVNAGENDENNALTYTVLSNDITLYPASRSNYEFINWYTSPTFAGNPINTITNESTGNVVLYAKWKAILSDISYVLDGGTNSIINPLTYSVKSNLVFTTPVKTGYTFLGWYDDETEGNLVTGITAGSLGNITLYARWELNNYVITYVLNGGTNNAENLSVYTVLSSDLTLLSPTRDGYTFAGWYNTYNFSDSAVTSFLSGSTGDITLYAKWNYITYSITYVLNGGTNGSNPSSYNITNNTITLVNAVRAGYTFIGWYSDAELSDAENSIAGGSFGNKEFYAKWEFITYTITYVLNGGDNDIANLAEYNALSEAIYGNAVREGHIFAGWYTSESFTGSPVTALSTGTIGNITLYAKWDIIRYNIIYNLDGGVNNISNPATYSYYTELNFGSPIKTGYTFEGWYLETELENLITNIEYATMGNIELFAKWSLTEFTVSYVLSGGINNEENPLLFDMNSESLALLNPSKAGYTFIGWYNNSAFTGSIINEIASGSLSDKTFYAKWLITNYSISYILDGGINGNNPYLYNITSGFTFSSAAKAGYTFEGWYDNAELSGDAVTAVTEGTTGNLSFFASWLIVNYEISYNLDGGINSGLNSDTYNVSDNISLSPASKDYYDFAGWYETSDYQGNAVTIVESGSTGNKVFYAKWAPSSYAITYNLDGGTNNAANPDKYTILVEITLGAPAKTGYSFEGWYDNEELSGDAVTGIAISSSGNKEFYAAWSIIVNSDLIYTLINGDTEYSVIADVTNNDAYIYIPSTYNGLPVTTIPNDGFRNKTNLVSIVIPSSITTIGTNILTGCTSLMSLTAPFKTAGNNVISYYFGGTSYSYNSLVPASLKTAEVSSGTTLLPNDVFRGCTNLTNVIIPASVTSIGTNVINGCSSLISVSVPLLETYSAGTYSYVKYYFGGSSYTNGTVPATLKTVNVINSISTLGNHAFYSCSSLIQINLPSSITAVGTNVFESCTALETVNLSDAITVIGNNAFKSCSNIININMPESLITIGSSAFMGCSKLENLKFKNNLTTIGLDAFRTCLALTDITIPSSISSIGATAFYGCSNLLSMHIPYGISTVGLGILQSCTKLALLEAPFQASASYITDNYNLLTYYFGGTHHTYSYNIPSSLKTVIISEGTLGIGKYSFYGASSVTNVVIPDTVLRIDTNAFQNCTGFSSFTVPESVTTVESRILIGCTNLNNITVPLVSPYNESTNSYLNFYFGSGYTTSNLPASLKIVTITEGTTGIGDYAFYKCNNITTLNIPENITSISSLAFFDNATLATINISIGNISYSVLDGILYNREKTAIVICPSGNEATNIIIPDTILSIGDSTFEGCTRITSINIPDSVNSIGAKAFKGCIGLTSLYIPDSVTSIGNDAFYNCSGLTSLSISGYAATLGTSLIYGCNALTLLTAPFGSKTLYNYYGTTVPAGLKVIGVAEGSTSIIESAFSGNSNLTTVTLPSTLASIGNNVFYSCININGITFNDNNMLAAIGNYAFYNCSKITAISLPESLNTIGNNAFYGTKLVSLAIPDNVIAIGEYAFQNITTLTTLTLSPGSQLATVGNRAFSSCSFNNLSLPETLISIGEFAFNSNNNLTRITLPSSVQSIGTYAFSNCSNILRFVVKRDIGSGITTIGSNAFTSYNPGLRIIVSADSLSAYKTASNWSTYSSLICSEQIYDGFSVEFSLAEVPGGIEIMQYVGSGGDVVVPSSINGKAVISIGKYAFYKYDTITSITLPYSITSIGIYAFAGCSMTSLTLPFGITSLPNNMASDCALLSSIVIPDSVTTIGSYVFSGCTSLISAELHNNATSIGTNMFTGCSSLESLTAPFKPVYNNSNNSHLRYYFGGTSYSTGTLPETLATLIIAEGATAIANDAFYNSKLSNITIPSSVTAIGNSVFNICTNLFNITIPESVTSIGRNAFISSGIHNNTPDNSVVYADGWIVGYKTTLSGTVTFNAEAKNMCQNGFSNLTNITSIVFEEGSILRNIGTYAFSGCTQLSSIVNLPDSLRVIEYNAFFNTGLINNAENNSIIYADNWVIGTKGTFTEIVIQDGTRGIAAYSMYNTSAANITLPSSLRYINEKGFYFNKNLVSINLPDGLLAIDFGAFSSCSALTSINIPASIKNIEAEAFYDCIMLSSIIFNEGLETIGPKAFYGNVFEEVILPLSLQSIGSSAFEYCQKLITVYIYGNTITGADKMFNVTHAGLKIIVPAEAYSNYISAAYWDTYSAKIVNSEFIYENFCVEDVEGGVKVLRYLGNSTDVTVPSTIDGKDVVSIGDYAFVNNRAIVNLVLPDSITAIGKEILRNCMSLESLTTPFMPEYNSNNHSYLAYFFGATSYGSYDFIPASLKTVNIIGEITAIGNNAFSGAVNVTEINLPDTITIIGSYAFYNCCALRNIVLPESLTAIGNYAFYSSGLTSIIIPVSVTSIGANSLSYCPLVSMTAPINLGINSYLRYYFGGSDYQSGTIPSTLVTFNVPEGTTAVANNTFYNASSLITINLPSGIQIIGSNAFYGCSNLVNINIPEAVVSINDFAFTGSGIINNAASNTIIYLQDWILGYNGTISEASFIPGTKGIGSGAFRNCTGLTSVVMPASLIHIGEFVFIGCTSLINVTLPEGITSIPKSMFHNCSSLSSIDIPDTVTDIGENAFVLTAMFNSVPNNNAVYIDNWLIDFKGTLVNNLIITEGTIGISQYALQYLTELNAVTIPASVMYINDYAMTKCSNLACVIIKRGIQEDLIISGINIFNQTSPTLRIFVPSDSVSDYNSAANWNAYAGQYNDIDMIVGDYATEDFDGGIKILLYMGSSDNIVVPETINGKTVVAIGSYSFGGSNISWLYIPGTVTTVDTNALTRCTAINSLTAPFKSTYNATDNSYLRYYFGGTSYSSGTLPNTLRYICVQEGTQGIGDYAFYNSPITELVFPNSLASLSNSAIYQCNSLTEIRFENNCLLSSIGTTFSGARMESITIPKNVISIADNAFQSCNYLTSITFAEGSMLKSIGNYAFSNCSNLTAVTFPDSVTSIGYYMFNGCNLLTSVSFEDNSQITALPDNAFSNISNEFSINFGANSILESIGNYAFYRSYITSINIPASVTYIGSNVFNYCEYLTSVTFAEDIQITELGMSVFSDCISLETITLPDSLITVGSSIFSGCFSLAEVIFGENSSLNMIGQNMFSNCYALTEFTVPDMVTVIEYNAFSSSNIHTIYISANVAAMEGDIFAYCNNLTNVIFKDNSLLTIITSNIFNGCNSQFNVSFGVNSALATIDTQAFYNKNILSIIIPDSVVSINSNAFNNCRQLTAVTFEAGSKLETIGDSAFNNCDKLINIVIPSSVKTIGSSAFNRCLMLESITFESGSMLETISSEAFSQCTSLTEITLPKNLTTVSSNVFQNCTSLRNVTFESGSMLTNISSYMFMGCYALTSIIIPENVTAIETAAFYECSALTSLTIGTGVTSISSNAFGACYALETVFVNRGISDGSLTSGTSSMFYNCPASLVIYVQQDSVDAYKAASYWSEYAGKIVVMP